MGSQVKGAVCGIVAAVAYGTNPLFSLNLYAKGMDVESVLFYRFAMAALALGAAMLLSGRSLAVSRRQLATLVPAGVVFALSSQTLYQSFLYMDAGVACSILFADELFRWNMAFQIRNADQAEPSDWEIASRYIFWTGMPLLANS